MKRYPIRLLLMASVAALALGVAAQVQAQTSVRCNVPFGFSLGGKELPSGVYTFRVAGDGGSKIVLVENWDARAGLFLPATVEDESMSENTVVTFDHYGSHYLLSSVSLPGNGISLHFSPTPAEREMMLGSRGEVVSIRASR